ncbi:MAG: hypothetical protein FJY97_14230 [candidate division Zixibacteria bacterium]|nr:hypothetical protein [candidate division Zixibacteria bacterium]
MAAPPGILCLFEDDTTGLAPVTWVRPAFDLRCGIRTLREKILSYYPALHVCLRVRPEIRELTKAQNLDIPVNTRLSGPTLFICGRVLMDARLAAVIASDGPDSLFMYGQTVVAARMHDPSDLPLDVPLSLGLWPTHIRRVQIKARVAAYPWDLVHWNQEELLHDFRVCEGDTAHAAAYPHVHLLNPDDIRLGTNVMLMPGVVLDATSGPIALGDHSQIMPFTYIQGPSYIGPDTVVRAGTRLYAGVSVGPVCRIGGEMAVSVVQGYSNKAHDGFLGHAFLGEWVNLGAGTTASNLKNTYGPISATIGTSRVETGRTFLGPILSDHVKTGIGTTLDTGTIVGFSSQITGGGVLPKYVPPFTWRTDGKVAVFRSDKAIEVARRMMERRQKTLDAPLEQRFLKIFDETTHERNAVL